KCPGLTLKERRACRTNHDLNVTAMAEKKPIDILREAIMLLTTRKLAPTPANYQAAYHEIAGTPDIPPFPEQRLREIAQALPVKNPEQQKQKGLFEHAIGQRNWVNV